MSIIRPAARASLTALVYGHTILFVASITIRSTYALDKETVERLANLARQWNVSKSEALRRAVRAADRGISGDDRVAALDALQASVQLSRRAATNWIARVRRQRKESGRRLSRSR
jgi:hypothetical protein